jgi:hypothetical protein
MENRKASKNIKEKLIEGCSVDINQSVLDLKCLLAYFQLFQNLPKYKCKNYKIFLSNILHA